MIILRADNRVLTLNAKFAYLVDNTESGSSQIEVSNSEPFEHGTPILLSEMGQTDAEVFLVNGQEGTSMTLMDSDEDDDNTQFAHPESTRVVALPYNQIRFFWTDGSEDPIANETPEFDDDNPLTDWEELDPSSYYSTYADAGHSSGFGWFMYRNSNTGETSQESNPIPYAGFTGNTAQQVFADFDSLLNTNELKLVSTADKFSWLNEAIAIFKNKLNLTDVEYTISTPQTIEVAEEEAEYLLPDDFSDLVEIVTQDGTPIEFISAASVMANNVNLPTTFNYYIRNRYIGFSPAPVDGSIIYYTYRAKAVRVTSLSTYIDLPDNAFYCLKDWMMYRACLKFTNPQSRTYYESFTNSVNLFMQSSVKRSANLDTWGISPASNV